MAITNAMRKHLARQAAADTGGKPANVRPKKSPAKKSKAKKDAD